MTLGLSRGGVWIAGGTCGGTTVEPSCPPCLVVATL